MQKASDITNGFYLEKSYKRKSTFGFLNKVKKDDKTYNLHQYLHGYCDIFVMKLFEFGEKNNLEYPICALVDEDGVIHSFIWIEGIENDYFIDVRGITSNPNYFFSEFEDYFDYQEYLEYGDIEDVNVLFFYNLDEYVKYLSNYLENGDDWYYNQTNILQESENIIQLFKEYYLVPKEFIE